MNDEIASLRAENARLIALLDANGIAWKPPPVPATPKPAEVPTLSTQEKVALFRNLFRGRTDVYPVRWEGKTSGKTGYAPACANEWRAGHRYLRYIDAFTTYGRLIPPIKMPLQRIRE